MASWGRRPRAESAWAAGRMTWAMMIFLLAPAQDFAATSAYSRTGPLQPAGIAPAAAPTFADVPFDHPYYIHIEALYQAGYTAGCATDPLRYCPEQTMNRAESAVFVERGIHSASYSPPTPSSQVFADLPLDSWAAGWVSGLWQDGYTAGCGTAPLLYCPWQGHTRAEGTVFYLRMLHGADFIPQTPTSSLFADVPLDAWYAGWVHAAYNAGLIPPCQTSPDLRFCPDDPLSRGLAAYMMVQAKGLLTPPDPSSAEWTQHAHDAQRTGFTAQDVETPWRWKWAWNGPNASGGVSNGKTELPRNVQPVTGGGRVYVAAGDRGVFALSKSDGSVLWNRSPGGSLNSTPAYDASTGALFIGSTNGRLYKVNATDGQVIGEYNAGASISTAPALIRDRLFFSAGTRVIALNPNTMVLLWAYEAGSTVHTPPSYSPSRDRVIIGTQDLYVHAIHATTGAQAWRVKPTVRQPGDPGDSSDRAEYLYGWPVVAEAHGLVLVKARLDWQSLWTWAAWPTTNAQIRANLEARPDQQALLVLDLDDGSVPFIANIGHGGYGDGGYLPMGPQPVVKRFADNSEVVYTSIRGHSEGDGRWDSHFGEMVLDDNTIPGLVAGYVRWIQYGNYGWPEESNVNYWATDEQVNLVVAGDKLLAGHWIMGQALEVTNRSTAYGSYSQPILSSPLPHLVSSTNQVPFTSSHHSISFMAATAGGTEWRAVPTQSNGNFYIYNDGVGKIYDQYWNGYATYVVSDGLVLFHSCDGTIVALEHGDPRFAAVTHGAAKEAAVVDSEDAATGSDAVHPSTGPEVISYTEVRSHIGERKTVEGEIRYLFNNGKAVYLGFKNPHQGELVIRIMKPDWANFPAGPETLYQLGQTIRVSGKIEWYQGDPVIYVQDPSHIAVLP